MTTLREAYDMVDRFLRNNLYDDDDYANYSEALELLSSEPPQRKPLTDEDIAKLMVRTWGFAPQSVQESVQEFARAIERAHGIGIQDE
jgi:hypothetical protein